MSLLAATTLFSKSNGCTEIMAHENWQRVKEIFADALRQKPKARSEFLDRACREDEELRREIESLLASFDSAESFMETPPVGDQVSFESRKFAKGETLAHYEIVRQIGTGGMGDVYLAQDSKLHRPVALKILREGLASEVHAQERLLREARAVAKLNHPNICAIYEISETANESFIVMEYASGETLADILTKERLSAKKSLEFAIQIADALGEAHAHKIIHRDIKPANIIVNSKGNLKVLDFGLAKIIEAETDSKATKNMSSSGAIMGTVPYMSPEQLRGKTLDARTDIFSFGVLLYEMLSGISPFQNDSNAETISAILNDEPDLSRIPSELQSIVQKCLAKDKTERYQTAQDLLFDLKNLPLKSFKNTDFQIQSSTVQELNFSTAENQPPITKDEPQTISPPNNRRWIWAISALAVLVAGFAGWGWWRSKQTDANPSAQLSVSQFTDWKRDLGEDLESSARFSPDGKLVAFASTRSGVSAIWLKQGGGGEPFTRKQDKWNEYSPIFSPDGQQIAFLSKRGEESGIWTMPTLGGTTVFLKTLEESYKQLIKWSKDGTTIYFQANKNLFALDLSTKEITKLTNFDSLQKTRVTLDISNDEKLIAYTIEQNNQTDIWVVLKNGGEPIRVTDDEFNEIYLIWHTDNQRIIYDSIRNGIRQIFAVGLDGKPPVQLIFSENSNYVSDVSPDGKQILYYSQRDDIDLWKVALDNFKETRLTENIGMEFWTDVAPDNSTIVFQSERPSNIADSVLHSSIISQTFGGENQSLKLTSDGFLPRFSPDGKRIAFIKFAANLLNLWTIPALGGETKPLTSEGINFGGYANLPQNQANMQEFQWSSDGRALVYCAHRGNVSNVWQTMVDGSGETRLTNNNDSSVRFLGPILSPDGQKIAWTGLAVPTDKQKKIIWSIWIYEQGKTKMLVQSESVLRLVGWTEAGRELTVKSVANESRDPNISMNVELFQVSDNGEKKSLFQLNETQFLSISLSPDGKNIGYVSRKDGKDSLRIISAKGGAERAILESNDARVYFAGLVWSPDGKSIYFGKQANWQIISMIENFN